MKIPVTIFHGTNDEVVPFEQGIRLAKENPGIEFIAIENGKHNNLSGFTLYQHRLDSLLHQ
jgi:pimeloyl-ACP methyl ester carboxylesterase